MNSLVLSGNSRIAGHAGTNRARVQTEGANPNGGAVSARELERGVRRIARETIHIFSLGGTTVSLMRLSVPAAVVALLATAAAWRPSFPTRHRCPSPVLLAPSTDLPPIAVVEAQLDRLQRGEIQSCFDFSSSQFRRAAGPRQRFEKLLRQRPEYRPLVDCKNYTVLSALQLGPTKWSCRVRVDNRVGSMPFSVEYRWELTQQGDHVRV